MPPKKNITSQMILTKAYELTRNLGYDHLSARLLAKELDCSTHPIYQCYKDMDELKKAIIEKATHEMLASIEQEADAPDCLSITLGYIRYALTEKKLFELIATNGTLFASALQTTPSSKLPYLSLNMIIFANGIIMMSTFGTLDTSWDHIKLITTKAYEAFKKEGIL